MGDVPPMPTYGTGGSVIGDPATVIARALAPLITPGVNES